MNPGFAVNATRYLLSNSTLRHLTIEAWSPIQAALPNATYCDTWLKPKLLVISGQAHSGVGSQLNLLQAGHSADRAPAPEWAWGSTLQSHAVLTSQRDLDFLSPPSSQAQSIVKFTLTPCLSPSSEESESPLPLSSFPFKLGYGLVGPGPDFHP